MNTWVLLLYLTWGDYSPPQVLEFPTMQECLARIAAAKRTAPQAQGLCLSRQETPSRRR